jgi:hypothetical protein
MKADQQAASIIHVFLKDKFGRVVLYDKMVIFWHLSNNNFYDLTVYSQQHEEGLALTMLAKQKEDGGLERTF